jgi:transcriptional regulator with XRE-family HTH domain
MPRISGKDDKNELLPYLGMAIRARRKALGLSQEALADCAGIDRAHMGKVERGERNVTVLNLQRIATALDCKLSEMFHDAGM